MTKPPPTDDSCRTPRTIGRLAHEAGVSVETVRFYERRGLLSFADAGALAGLQARSNVEQETQAYQPAPKVADASP